MPISKAFFEAVADEWRRRGVPLMRPAAEDEVIRLFTDLDHPLSADVLGLYTTVGGFVEGECDGLWSFWSTDRIRWESQGHRRPFILFADYLINSHLYSFHFETTETSSVYVTHDGLHLEPKPVANSVVEFLEKLLWKPNEVESWHDDEELADIRRSFVPGIWNLESP